ncbi:hypothetical protein [Sphingobacterium mizutaii]|uniref:hypothetical protein n=1 Tax=Sphingobacterium mizutaii TaxID=1010 RepID=UPI001629EFF8|nr:hypothetical protein [Sphingobacterium mizutaii]
MMKENEKILNLIQVLMNNQMLSDFLKEYDYSVNLFGLKISDSRHYFLRLSQPKDEIILWMQEEYIPKLDHTGKWIQYPAIENPRVERIEASTKYIPTDLTYEEFKNNLVQFFEQLKKYQANHLQHVSLEKLNQSINDLIAEINSLSK